jgi:PDDEXK-like domain of unknown function (DUF3799)
MNKVIIEPAEAYHSVKDYISSTPLRQMELSPRHFFEAWTKPSIEPNAAMENGTLIHSLVLEQDVAKFCARPLDEKGALVRSNSKEYAAFLAANPGKTAIHPDLYNQMNECLTAFCENKTAMKLIDGARIENSVYALDPETGLKIKARPDAWKDGVLIDVKTTGRRLDRFFEKSIFANGYDIQLAHYAECILAATGEIIDTFYVLALEQKAPFSSRVYKIDKRDIESAKSLRRQYLNQISTCIADSTFPSYEDIVIEVVKPTYLETLTDITFNVG